MLRKILNIYLVSFPFVNTREYIYDIANRLDKEILPNSGGTKTYTYHPDGSIKSEKMNNGTPIAYNYEKGRLVKRGLVSYGYDNLGNCTNFGGLNLAWERGSLLKGYGTHVYDYNAQGVRYRKTGGTTSIYFHDGTKLLEEQRGNVQIRYLYDAEGIIGFSIPSDRNNDDYFFSKDVSGNVRAIFRAQVVDGIYPKTTEVARYEYDAWGNTTVSSIGTNTIGGVSVAQFNRIRWKGQYQDESDLYYIGGRYYSPATKQYLSPAGPESAFGNAAIIYGLNQYSLCLTNSVNMEYNNYTIATNAELSYDPDALSNWKLWWSRYGGFVIGGVLVVVGIIACLIPGGQAIGAGLIVSGVSQAISTGLQLAGVKSKLAMQIMSGLNIVCGLIMSFTPLAPMGWSMIGAGIGGYIAEKLGGSYAVGWVVGSIVGGIIGSYAYKSVQAMRTNAAARANAKALASAAGAEAARDAKVAELQNTLTKKQLKEVAAVVGGYDKVTGDIAVGVKYFDKLPYCAEARVVEQLGGMSNISNIVMTSAIRPHNMTVVAVCNYCQSIYSTTNFLPGTPFQ